MKKIPITLKPTSPRSSMLYIERGLLAKIPEFLRKYQKSRIIVLCDRNIKKIFGATLLKALRAAKFKADLIDFPAGERFKNEETKLEIERQLFQKKCGRDTLLVNVGGGVVGDLGGFVAATYMRGIPYVHVPTSLLAMVDSSIGGKVGIDTTFGKNLIGAFWQPMAIFVDPDVLKSLSEEQYRNGLFEILKIFLTSDRAAFELFEKKLPSILRHDPIIVEKIMARAIRLKIATIERDERESGERMVLNFGHTVGHALEYATNYKLPHGFAVARGILVENKISELLGLLKPGARERIEQLISILLPPMKLPPITPSGLIAAMHHDKKNSGGKIHFVLLKAIGEVTIRKDQYAHPVPPALIKKALPPATSY